MLFISVKATQVQHCFVLCCTYFPSLHACLLYSLSPYFAKFIRTARAVQSACENFVTFSCIMGQYY